MSLQVWLPLNGDLHNQGLCGDITFSQKNTTVTADGKISNNCYDFNGSSSRIYGDTVLPNSISNTISIACWAKIDSTATANGYLCGLSKNNANFMMCYYYSSSSQIMRIYYAGSSRTTFNLDGYMDAWHHYACVSTGEKLLFYIDGELKKEVTYAGAALGEDNHFCIGSRNAGSVGTGSIYFKGQVNDVRFYDHALSAKEVEELAKGLILHYKLDQGNPNLLKLGNVEQSGNSQATHILYYYFDTSDDKLPTGTYTFSFDIKSSNGTDNCYISYANGASTIKRIATLTSIPDNWTHYSYTFTNAATNCNDIFFTSYKSYGSPTNTNNTGYIYVKNVKLENGTSETPFCLALSEEPNNIVYDSSGYGNNGTIVGSLEPITPSPRYSRITNFSDGSISGIPLNFLNKGNLTISFWGYSTDWTATQTSVRSVLANYSSNSGIRFYRSANQDRLRLQYGYLKLDDDSISNSTLYFHSSGALENNSWHHFALTINSNNGTLNVATYKDGEVFSSTSTEGRIFNHTLDTNFTLSAPEPNEGHLNDFRIYATALTPDQIKELYNTSMSIDNKDNIHARELVETTDNIISVSKTGQLKSNTFQEDYQPASFNKLNVVEGHNLYEY